MVLALLIIAAKPRNGVSAVSRDLNGTKRKLVMGRLRNTVVKIGTFL